MFVSQTPKSLAVLIYECYIFPRLFHLVMGKKRYFCSHCNDYVSRSTRSRHLKEIATTSGTSYDTDNSDLESESFDSCDFEKDGQDLVSGSYSPRDSEGKTVMQQ